MGHAQQIFFGFTSAGLLADAPIANLEHDFGRVRAACGDLVPDASHPEDPLARRETKTGAIGSEKRAKKSC
jgi:hypothetical protein